MERSAMDRPLHALPHLSQAVTPSPPAYIHIFPFIRLAIPFTGILLMIIM
jgi:hypothetical protein